MATASLLDVQRPSAHVVQVFLNRPAVRNAFNDEVIATLTSTFTQLAQEPALRAIVLGGHGASFCAGGDLHWMQAMAGYSWEQNRADAQALADMLWAIYRCPVPVVGRVQGDCYAGGVGLAAVCDVVVAANDAAFCISEARVGLLPGTISPYVIRAMGEQQARRYFVTAERFDAARAQQLGLVHELCTPEQLDATVAGLVQALCNNGPEAVRASKRIVQEVAGQPLTEALREGTAQRIADIRASDEGREGVQAFLAKRPPAWRLP
jgi:methylglutaconyl-CoA hydratase